RRSPGFPPGRSSHGTLWREAGPRRRRARGLIGPVRRLTILLRLAVMLPWLICCVLFYYLWLALRRHNPWPRIFLGGIAWLSGVDVRIQGHRAGRGTLMLANHLSWIDIPAIAGATGTTFVAHDGLADVPFVRWLC